MTGFVLMLVLIVALASVVGAVVIVAMLGMARLEDEPTDRRLTAGEIERLRRGR